jgi:hypothetical protein
MIDRQLDAEIKPAAYTSPRRNLGQPANDGCPLG